jgi:polysaccharide export outer membrane protein
MRKILPLIVVSLLLAGCATRPIGGAPNLTVLETASLPVPQRRDLADLERAYYIGPFDEITVDVFGIEDMSREIQVDASGRISFPLVGTIIAGGKTPDEVAQEIRLGLMGSFVREPQVTVNLKETVSQVVTVEGEVKEPGLYPVMTQMTLLKAVASAKGTTEFSSLKDVVIFRTVGAQRYAGLYNLEAIRRGAYPDPEIYANDIVVVGDSPGRRLFANILQIVPLLTTPVVVALQNGR